jgi:uncharacterized membrane protein
MPERHRVKRWRVVYRDRSHGVALLVAAIVVVVMIAVVWLFATYERIPPAQSYSVLEAVLTPGMSGSELVGKVAVQAVPGSIGALLAQSQLGGRAEEQQAKRFEAGYGGQLFLMAVGAVFLALSVAPTEEMP